MAQDYYTILTNAGLAYEAQQKAQNKPITLTHYCVCDGNGAVYNPDPAMTALRREVTPRLPLNALLQDPSNPTWLVAEGLLPDDVGGWTIRALGIYTDTGILYAVSKCSESVKPLLARGSGKQFYVRVIFQTSNAASVTLLVDNSVVMAPRSFVIDHVRDELAKRDHKQSVRVATVEPITLSGEQNIDGQAVVAGDRVLVKDQAAAAANGIYVVAIGVWTRATDADSGAKLNPGATVPVEGGTVNADTQWMLKTDGLVTVGATGLVFQWVGGQNAPDRPEGDNSRSVANTAYVDRALATAGMPRFTTYLWSGRGDAMPAGDQQSSGQQLPDVMHPTMRADVVSTQFYCTEAEWQADPYKRVTHWSLGDGTTTTGGWMRPPDKNGVQPGNVGAFYGVGSNPAGSKTGTALIDAMRNVAGTSAAMIWSNLTGSQSGPFSVLQDPSVLKPVPTGGTSMDVYPLKFDASKALPAGTTTDPITGEFRPRSWYGIWMIRMYGRVSNPGALNAVGLNARMDMIDARVSTLEARQKALGDGQMWVDVTASRTPGTTYTNNTGRAIQLGITAGYTTGTAHSSNIEINGIPLQNGFAGNFNAVIPNGATYRYVQTGSGVLLKWMELRG